MNRVLLFLALLCAGQAVHAQYVYTIKADSVKITNSCDTAELIIENHTQTVPGFLFNKGHGRTEFRRGMFALNDSVYLIGADTLDFNKAFGKYYKQGGNAFGSTALLGTKDNFPLTFLQNNRETARVDTSGHWLFNTAEDKGYLAQFNGDTWTAGVIYQDKNVNIVPFGGIYGDARINIGGNSVIGHATVALGSGMQVDGTGAESVGIGFKQTVAHGIGILGSTAGGIAIGEHAFADTGSIVLGKESVSTGKYQLVCGGPDYQNEYGKWTKAIYNVYFGSGVQRNNQDGPGLSYTINGSGGYGTNKDGGAITIAGGKGTGSGIPGSVIFATAQTGSSGTTLQDLSEKARIAENGNFGIGTSTPSARLHVSGTSRFDNITTTSGHRSAIRNTSTDITIGDTDEYIFVTAASPIVTITLPNAAVCDGQTYTIKKVNNGNLVNVTNASSQMIDGSGSYALTNQWQFVTVVANGGSWMIVSKN